MILDNFLIHSFEPLFLTIDKIGPFQESPVVFDFTNEDDEPCNFFYLYRKMVKEKQQFLN